MNPMSRSTRASQSLCEVGAQCSVCHDFFTVELSPVGKAGKQRSVRPILTPRLAYKDHQLIHRPGVCDGVVRLIGIPRVATF